MLEQVSKSRYHDEVKLGSPAAAVRQWLGEAYALGG
jgi:hypothetical protein